nr:immunoglobulin heavy chain junction region [Macaca mulatta]MOW22723.1 immunoglobulin heavy chain junction region [Macaca mulatta]MOW22817.1 immunoglobulin heavy chain junction region [Macaca mulatta]MOW22867.1 immunoglobulin heavy chain junction region [Macaca mulatta]MOW22889.1 immunoglobulin heavy chain junction region [Macaca mulatta]
CSKDGPTLLGSW